MNNQAGTTPRIAILLCTYQGHTSYRSSWTRSRHKAIPIGSSGLQTSSTPSPSTSNNTKSTYFAAMIYYRKTLFGRGPKLTAVHECALQMNSILFGVHRDWREADVMLQLVAAEEASD